MTGKKAGKAGKRSSNEKEENTEDEDNNRSSGAGIGTDFFPAPSAPLEEEISAPSSSSRIRDDEDLPASKQALLAENQGQLFQQDPTHSADSMEEYYIIHGVIMYFHKARQTDVPNRVQFPGAGSRSR